MEMEMEMEMKMKWVLGWEEKEGKGNAIIHGDFDDVTFGVWGWGRKNERRGEERRAAQVVLTVEKEEEDDDLMKVVRLFIYLLIYWICG